MAKEIRLKLEVTIKISVMHSSDNVARRYSVQLSVLINSYSQGNTIQNPLTPVNDELHNSNHAVHSLVNRGGKQLIDSQTQAPTAIVPHPRTLRKAREQVKYMVIDEVSPCKIRNYLHRWVTWWVKTSDAWQYHELLQWLIDSCWDTRGQNIAQCVYLQYFNKLHTRPVALVAGAA